MTAITLNLLAEEQQAQQARARDPLKAFIAIGVGVVAMSVALGSVLSVFASQKRIEAQALEERWHKLDEVGEEEGEFRAMKMLAEDIVAINHSRALIAPQLAMVKDLVPATVELSLINLAAVADVANAGDGGEEGATGKKSARPKRFERLVLRMEGKVVSSRPELEVDQFLQALRTDAQFSAVVEDIQLRSISRTAANTEAASGALAGANFVVECQYKRKE